MQQLTNLLSEEIKSGVLYSDLSGHFLILHYSVIRVNRVEEIQQNNSFFIDQLNNSPST